MRFDPKANKSILITGGTGSLGQAIVKKCLNSGFRRIIIFSRDEYKQSVMKQNFQSGRLRFFIGDIRDRIRLRMALSGVSYVIHTAALKRVESAEQDPMEFVNTNVLGSQNVILSSIDTGVDKVLAVSTDKAVNPVGLYGATKLCADKLFIAANNYNGPRFSVVRFGNFIDSRGSIFELLSDKKVKTFTITHRDMTRFFIKLDDAADLCLSVLSRMTGSELFLPKMTSKKIIDLVNELRPDMDIIDGQIRQGEKIHEEMLSNYEMKNTFDLGDYYVTYPFESRVGIKISPSFKYISSETLED